MDSIKTLTENIPDWIKRLDELNGQIEQRQVELARLVELQTASPTASPPSRTKSVRNKGSTESLKPRDEDAPWHDEAPQEPAHTSSSTASPAHPKSADQPPDHHTNQVTEVAQARARATLRKRNKRSDSIVSTEGAVPKYRTRSMIIVYYDSYVQSIFESLVKFVSAQRNMMRKAKMAAKVAQIKRMAELEMDDDSGDDGGASDKTTTAVASTGTSSGVASTDAGQLLAADTVAPIAAASQPKNNTIIEADDTPSLDPIPALNYRRTTNMRSPGMVASGRPTFLRASGHEGYVSMGPRGSYLGSSQQAPDVYDELDKGLEYVQSTCERAAHQFLRDGECTEEIEKIKRRLVETKEQADREMARAVEEDPAALAASRGPVRVRNFRPQGMRRELSSSAAANNKGAGGPVASTDGLAAIEVDEGVQDMDAAIPRLVYKSSRVR